MPLSPALSAHLGFPCAVQEALASHKKVMHLAMKISRICQSSGMYGSEDEDS